MLLDKAIHLDLIDGDQVQELPEWEAAGLLIAKAKVEAIPQVPRRA